MNTVNDKSNPSVLSVVSKGRVVLLHVAEAGEYEFIQENILSEPPMCGSDKIVLAEKDGEYFAFYWPKEIFTKTPAKRHIRCFIICHNVKVRGIPCDCTCQIIYPRAMPISNEKGAPVKFDLENLEEKEVLFFRVDETKSDWEKRS